mmetsp:Transcript_14247/g.24236  ORF Transcript_14247/g.24236 Transcript_14247/m.24236 type:complete len:168 (-) Transcript_14247:2106-2609(-)
MRYASLLSMRFKERDDNVKLDILDSFQNLFKAAIVQNTSSGPEVDLSGVKLTKASSSFMAQTDQEFPKIVSNLIKQLKSKNIKVKVAVMKTFSVLAYMNQARLEHHLADLIPHIEQCVKENNNDYITYSLEVLKNAFGNVKPTKASLNAQQSADRIAKFIKDSMGHH